MLSPHTSLSIAQVVFYVPIVPAAFYITRRNWHYHPRMAWYPLCLFSLMRLAGGALVIVQGQAGNQDNIGLIIAALVLLNVGLVPMIMSSLGLLRLVLATDTKGSKFQKLAIRAMRIAILIAVILLAAGGGLVASGNTADTGRILEEVGYVIFACMVAVIVTMLVSCARGVYIVDIRDRVYLHGGLLSMPFLIVRAVYGLIYVFDSSSIYSIWNPLFGNPVAFSLMALLPEYIVLLIFIYLGFFHIHNPPAENSPRKASQKTDVSVEI